MKYAHEPIYGSARFNPEAAAAAFDIFVIRAAALRLLTILTKEKL
jgi:hypothetical protein